MLNQGFKWKTGTRQQLVEHDVKISNIFGLCWRDSFSWYNQ